MAIAIIDLHVRMRLRPVQSRHQSHHHSPYSVPLESAHREVAPHRRGTLHWQCSAKYHNHYALSLTVGIHQFLELSGILDFEKDFFAVLSR